MLFKESYGELKGVMWLFRREFKELRPEEKTLLNCLFVYSPKSESALDVNGYERFPPAHTGGS